MSIRTRLTLWYSSLLAIVLVVFGLALFSVLNWAWRDQIQSSLMAIANQVATLVNVDQPSGQVSVQSMPPLGDSVSLSPYYAQVWAPGGRLLSTSDPGYQNPLDPMMLGTPIRQLHEFMLNNKHYYVLTVPFGTAFGGPLGSIQVATRLDAIDQAGQHTGDGDIQIDIKRHRSVPAYARS